MKKLSIKDKEIKKMEVPPAILTKLERREAYLMNHNHKPKTGRKEIRA